MKTLHSTTRVNISDLSRNLPSHDSLLALLAFAEEQDMVKAAKRISLSQPALSFHLKKLEQSLGFAVFTFSGKRKVLTRMGKAYVDLISKTFSELYLSKEQVAREALDIEHQTLRVAGRRELLIPFLSYPFPGTLEFLQTTSSEALEHLRSHRVDLVISARVEQSSDFLAKVFFESGFRVVVPKAWKVNSIDRNLFLKPVIAYGRHQAYLKELLEEYGSENGGSVKNLKVHRIVEDWYSVVEMVRLGHGWAVIPEAWEIHTDQVKVIQIENSESLKSQKVFMFYRREDRKSEWAKNLEEWLKARQS